MRHPWKQTTKLQYFNCYVVKADDEEGVWVASSKRAKIMIVGSELLPDKRIREISRARLEARCSRLDGLVFSCMRYRGGVGP